MPETGPVPRPRSRPRPAEASAHPANGAHADEPTYLDPRWKRYREAIEEYAAARRAVYGSGLVLNFEQAAWAEHTRQFFAQVRVEPLGLGYRASAAEGISMTLTRLRDARGDLTAELAISRHDNHLLRQRLNLSSGQARAGVAKMLSQHPFGGKVEGADAPDWREVLEQVAVQVLDADRQPPALQLVGDAPPSERPPRVIEPFLPDGPTLIWAPQGVGKSTLAAAIVVTLETYSEVLPGWHPTDHRRCLVLDWEASATEWNDRLARIARGVDEDPPQVPYVRMRRPLADAVEELSGLIAQTGARYLVVDSFEKAAGARVEGSTYEEKAERVFLALDRLGLPALLVDHVAGEDFRRNTGAAVVTPKSIGSTLKGAWARATYDLKRDPGSIEGDRSEMVLHNVKVNDEQRHRPYEFAIVYDEGSPGPIRFERSRLTSPELMATLPLAERMARLLLAGARTVKDLAKELDAAPSSIRSVLSRDGGKRFVRMPEDQVGLSM